MKKSVIYALCIVIALYITACGNTQTVPTSTASSVAPTSTVAVVEEPYVAIGGINPYEELTPTEEANIKKAEEEARLQAEAKAKADAEAKAQAEAKKQAEVQQAQASQQEVAEQPQQTTTGHDWTTPAPAGYHWYTYPSGKRVLMVNNAEIAIRETERAVAELEARGYYGRNKDDVPPEMKQQRSGVVAAE